MRRGRMIKRELRRIVLLLAVLLAGLKQPETPALSLRTADAAAECFVSMDLSTLDMEAALRERLDPLCRVRQALPTPTRIPIVTVAVLSVFLFYISLLFHKDSFLLRWLFSGQGARTALSYIHLQDGQK